MVSCSLRDPRIAVVIPCYKVLPHIENVLNAIGPEVWRIYVVNDCCPDGSGDFVQSKFKNDSRICIISNKKNIGVGGAVLAGYRRAISDEADIIVKIDGDGQMAPSLIPRFVSPIIKGQADYTKGNRFYNLDRISNMPPIRVFGNAILSFMTKLSSGYWSIFDPANGYTAIHAKVAAHLPMNKISNRYFFETDMLFRLNALRAVVVDIPMDAVYDDEKSNLHISKIFVEFLYKHSRNFAKRIFYNYFLRDMTLASIELLVGATLLIFGVVFGGVSWFNAVSNNRLAPLGTIMLAALPVLLGIQLLLAGLGFDIANVPKRPIHGDLPDTLHNQKAIKYER
jgi:glycosyltransferase involved in cell wall biosynthesis